MKLNHILQESSITAETVQALPEFKPFKDANGPEAISFDKVQKKNPLTFIFTTGMATGNKGDPEMVGYKVTAAQITKHKMQPASRAYEWMIAGKGTVVATSAAVGMTAWKDILKKLKDVK